MLVKDFFENWWHTILVVGGFVILIIIQLKYKIPDIIRRLNKVERRQEERIVNGKYMTDDRCGTNQTNCRNTLCRKFDEQNRKFDAQRSTMESMEKRLGAVERGVLATSVDVKNLIRDRDNIDEVFRNVLSTMLPKFLSQKGGDSR